MRSIEVDEDVYAYLLRNVEYIGEDASSILRRVLEIERPPVSAGRDHPGSELPDDGDWLQAQVESEAFRRQRTATDRYLFVLARAHERAPEQFARVLAVSGRKRNYFGTSEADISSSGNATYPQRIPNTRYWAMTNASTGDKREILIQVLKELGYKPHVAERVSRSI